MEVKKTNFLEKLPGYIGQSALLQLTISPYKSTIKGSYSIMVDNIFGLSSQKY